MSFKIKSEEKTFIAKHLITYNLLYHIRCDDGFIMLKNHIIQKLDDNLTEQIINYIKEKKIDNNLTEQIIN